jgi:hypothetical protein
VATSRVAIIGFRYGSIVPYEDELSYTDLEFRAATTARIPRLVFLLREDAAVPESLVDTDRRLIDAFRSRLKSADLIIKEFVTPDGLEAALVHALMEIRVAQEPADPRAASRWKKIHRPWMSPAISVRIVDRPELMAELVAALTQLGPEAGPTIAGLEGAGGFGKTTLAAAACRQSAIDIRFPGGVLWATVGEKITDAGLAEILNSLCEVLIGERGTSSDPLVVGTRLGELLNLREPTLLVVDDIWTSSQLAPFLIGGGQCCRLVTTRIGGLLPADAVAISVDAMNGEEARIALTAEVQPASRRPGRASPVFRTWVIVSGVGGGRCRAARGAGAGAGGVWAGG